MKPQRGFIALLMMVLIAVGVFGAMAAWVASDPSPSKQSINQQVLMQAREALLAYVAVSGTPASMLALKTRLPCPDRIGDGVADTSTSTCLATGETAFGLLPWSTLGLPPLRDADGECLWYAVSGDFKDAAPAAIVRPVNADTDGRITVSDEAGRTLATQLVAVVFAPGTNLTQQARNAMAGGADKPCVTPSGNAIADAALYLDKIVLSGGATINNAQPASVASAPVTFSQLTGTVDKQSLLNDQLAWITADDYAATATQRNAEVLKQELTLASAAAGGRMPFASLKPGGTCDPGRYSGFLPSFCSYTNTTAGTTPLTFTFDIRTLETTSDEWPQQAFYAVTPECTFDVASCNTTTGSALLVLPTKPTAKAVVLMRGRAQLNPSCPPTTSTSTLNQLLPCIENTANRTALSDDPMAKLLRTFVTPDKRPTSNDVLQELP